MHFLPPCTAGRTPRAISRERADIFIALGRGPLGLSVWDVLVSSLLLSRPIIRGGIKIKNNGYNFGDFSNPTIEREGISFIPLPVETLGGWHKKAVEQLRKLARAQARSSGKEEDDAIRHLFQRLGVLLVKGNAALILNRIPSFSLPDIDGEL